MADVRLRTRARLDLIALHNDLSRRDGRLADRHLAAIADGLEVLKMFPLGGPSRPDLRDGLRMLPVNRHIVYYMVEDDTVIVERVLHHAQDAAAAFR